MLGSDHDGERANAAAQATRILHEHGLTWADAIGAPGGGGGPPPPPPPADDDDDEETPWRALTQAILDSGGGNTWEKNFCADLLTRGRKYALSDKQKSKLDAIFKARVRP